MSIISLKLMTEPVASSDERLLPSVALTRLCLLFQVPSDVRFDGYRGGDATSLTLAVVRVDAMGCARASETTASSRERLAFHVHLRSTRGTHLPANNAVCRDTSKGDANVY